MQQAQKALRQRNKELKETPKEETTDWSLYAKRLEKEKSLYAKSLKKEIIDAKRETVAGLRSFYASQHLVRQEASREAAVLWKRCNELVELVDRVRSSRRGVLIAEEDHLVDQLRELTQRRTINASRMSDANVEARRAAVLKKKLRVLQEQHAELWSSDAVDYAWGYPRLAVRAQELEVHLNVLKAQLKAGDADMAELRRSLAPPPPMAQGAYGDQIRFMAMELMGEANVCATQVPSVIDIVARYYGIRIPDWVKGKGDNARILPWVPSLSTCLRIRCEMGALSQLQVGE